MLRQNYLLRALLLLLLLLPWVGVGLGFLESWRTYSIGDEMLVPLWAWLAVVLLPVGAVALARMMANRLVLQWILRKRMTKNNRLK